MMHDAIVALATAGAGAETSDDLRDGLLKEGYVLSRQALFLRSISCRVDTNEFVGINLLILIRLSQKYASGGRFVFYILYKNILHKNLISRKYLRAV